MKRIFILLLSCVLLAAGCSGIKEDGTTFTSDAAYMENAANELMDVLWNVDYETFTPDKTTAFAKKYYDSDFLADYLEDVRLNSGIDSIVEEKLKSRVLSTSSLGDDEEMLGDTLYNKFKIRAKIEIISYDPVYPEESFFEKGKTYELNYTLYFKEENGSLKLSAFGFEPENKPFLPKKAQNVTLTPAEVEAMKELAKKYYSVRYNFDYKNYNAKEVFEFYRDNLEAAFMESEGITQKYIEDFKEDIKQYKMRAEIVSLDIVRADKNKSRVDNIEGTKFYYILVAELKYKVSALPSFFEKSEIEPEKETAVSEMLGFVWEGGKPKIAYAEYR